MGSIPFQSPVSVAGSPVPSLATLQAADTVALGTLFRPQDQVYPAPGAAPLPMLTDGGIASGQPSPTTGLRFIPWTQLTAFNYQGLFMQQASASWLSGAGITLGANLDTPRKYGYGTDSAEFMPGTLDLRFDTDSTRVIPVWWHSSAYNGSNYNDQHMMVSDRGVMKHLSNGSANNGLPRTSTAGTGLRRRELAFNDRRWRSFRHMSSGFTGFAGVWIDTLSSIRKPANHPLVFMHNGDSWNEPNGASWDTGTAGDGFPTGSYQCLGLPQVMSFYTGMCHGTIAQGGTGEFATNGGSSGEDLTGYSGNGFSAMWSDSRVNDAILKFGPQFPIILDIGGWNDGGSPGRSGFDARVTARYTKLFANSTVVGRDIRAINVGIQPVDITGGTADSRYLSTLGQADAAARFPGKVLGHVSLMNPFMWHDTGISTLRSIYCHSAPGGSYIHLNISGNHMVGGYIAARLASMAIDKAYVTKTMGA